MRKVFSDPSLGRCDLVRSVLEARGIECTIRNDLSSLTTGHGYPVPSGPSLPFATPQVWILDDRRYDQALELLLDGDCLDQVGPDES